MSLVVVLAVGVLIGLAIGGIVFLVMFQTHRHFVGEVRTLTDSFASAARADIKAYQESMAGAMQNLGNEFGKVIQGTKRDVEIIKQRVGGAFPPSVPLPTQAASETETAASK
jgi:hypothetical protein